MEAKTPSRAKEKDSLQNIRESFILLLTLKLFLSNHLYLFTFNPVPPAAYPGLLAECPADSYWLYV